MYSGSSGSVKWMRVNKQETTVAHGGLTGLKVNQRVLQLPDLR
jgi:hypothetical protein